MSGRNRARPGRPSVTPQDGAYVTGQQLLDFAANAQAAAAPPAPTHPSSGFARLCSEYANLGGKSFKGSEGIIEVQAWLKSCDRIFTCMDLSDLHRIQVVSRMLHERALGWYELLTYEIAEAQLTWVRFKEKFELKFVPEAEKVNLARRFVDLVQGESSLT